MTIQLFSNNHRPLKILISFTIIILLGFYAVLSGPDTEITFDEIKINPEKYLNQEIPFDGQVINKNNQQITLKDRGELIDAINLDLPIPKEDSVSGIARIELIEEQPVLNIQEYHHHNFWWFKILSGPITLGILGLLFFKKYKFDTQDRTFKTKYAI